ncbi:hypothetical protein G6F35_016097 [Rhizopus arrhizus]|nr:hypothetical protein G6F35_016097 [Rhizopus arrhizus]
MAPTPGAIMLPEATPAPMACEGGSKMFRLVMKPAISATNSAPITVPAGLAAHREGGADGFTLDAKQQRQRQADGHGAEEVAEFLEHQGPAGFAHLRQRSAHHQAQLGQERQQRVLQIAADAGLHGLVDARTRRQALAESGHDRADEDGPEHRLQNDLARAYRERDTADRFGNDDHQQNGGQHANAGG